MSLYAFTRGSKLFAFLTSSLVMLCPLQRVAVDRDDQLSVSSNKNNIYSSLFISLMNNWYGYPGIPVELR